MHEGDDVPPEQFAADLTTAIVEMIALQAAAEEFDVTPADAEAEAKLDEIEGEIEASGQTLEEVLTAQSIPEERAIEIARLQVLRDQVIEQLQEGEEVPEADIVAAYRLRELGAIEVCAHHILVETEEEANEAIQRIEDGEDFEEVAADVSTDPGCRGELGRPRLSAGQQLRPALCRGCGQRRGGRVDRTGADRLRLPRHPGG